MPTVTVKTEVEATPELIAEQLKKYAAPFATAQFPYPAGTFVEVSANFIEAFGAVEGMPGLVMMSGVGSPLGVVALYKANGDITVAYLAAAHLVGPYKFPST